MCVEIILALFHYFENETRENVSKKILNLKIVTIHSLTFVHLPLRFAVVCANADLHISEVIYNSQTAYHVSNHSHVSCCSLVIISIVHTEFEFKKHKSYSHRTKSASLLPTKWYFAEVTKKNRRICSVRYNKAEKIKREIM